MGSVLTLTLADSEKGDASIFKYLSIEFPEGPGIREKNYEYRKLTIRSKMDNKKIRIKILKFLFVKGKKVTTREIKNHIFPPFKRTNPKNSFKIIQKEILDLMKRNKLEIISSQSCRYVTSKEIKDYLKEKKITGNWQLPGIDEVSTKCFFDTILFVKYVKLK